jgi:hypothetical protein
MIGLVKFNRRPTYAYGFVGEVISSAITRPLVLASEKEQLRSRMPYEAPRSQSQEDEAIEQFIANI